jgi:hypothetical protein
MSATCDTQCQIMMKHCNCRSLVRPLYAIVRPQRDKNKPQHARHRPLVGRLELFAHTHHNVWNCSGCGGWSFGRSVGAFESPFITPNLAPNELGSLCRAMKMNASHAHRLIDSRNELIGLNFCRRDSAKTIELI